MKSATKRSAVLPQLEKVPTGIFGLDEITGGGLPKGRPTLVFGSAGSGKTLMAVEFLVKGATQYGEPGVLMSFEESEGELITNVGTLGFDLKGLIDSGRIVVDQVAVERSEIEETGEYDLEGLFVRLGTAIDSIKAKRVVLDTIEVLYAGLSNSGIIRAELRRLFRWLKDKGVTTIVTGERAGDSMLTRHGLEEYVSDCVIFLDNRVAQELSTRRLRIVKYRGSAHSTNEFPFIIDERGFSVIPSTMVKLEYAVSDQRVPTGIASLDAMLGGRGYLKGTSILASGMVGTGKSSLAAAFVDAACARDEKCLYFAFEEAPAQIMRNMKSIGIDLGKWEKKGLLQFSALRPSEQGLERHLVSVERTTDDFKPAFVVVDALTDFLTLGSELEVRQMVLRLVDFLKTRGVSAMFTSMAGLEVGEQTGVGLSSAFDTWIHLTNVQENNERTRTIVIVKSRGMAHSNQVREFIISDKGVDLTDIYTNAAGSFMGSARLAQMAVDRAEEVARAEGIHARESRLEEKRRRMEAQIASLRAEFEAEAKEDELAIRRERAKGKALVTDRQALEGHRREQPKSRRKETKP